MLIYVGIGGFFGAISRYLLAGMVQKWSNSGFPYGTLSVNIIGSFLLAFIIELSIERMILSPELRVAITTGFLGAFTTFSTFSYESVRLLLEGKYTGLLYNILLNVILCLFMSVIGIYVARKI